MASSRPSTRSQTSKGGDALRVSDATGAHGTRAISTAVSSMPTGSHPTPGEEMQFLFFFCRGDSVPLSDGSMNLYSYFLCLVREIVPLYGFSRER